MLLQIKQRRVVDPTVIDLPTIEETTEERHLKIVSSN